MPESVRPNSSTYARRRYMDKGEVLSWPPSWLADVATRWSRGPPSANLPSARPIPEECPVRPKRVQGRASRRHEEGTSVEQPGCIAADDGARLLGGPWACINDLPIIRQTACRYVGVAVGRWVGGLKQWIHGERVRSAGRRRAIQPRRSRVLPGLRRAFNGHRRSQGAFPYRLL